MYTIWHYSGKTISLNPYPKLKKVIARPMDLNTISVKHRASNTKIGSVVGPTIKTGSRLSAYFPEIGVQKQGQKEMIDIGALEPAIGSANDYAQNSEIRNEDGIQYWTAAGD